MKNALAKTIGALAVAALSTVSAFAQTTGFIQTGAGPYDYNDTANWVGGTINGIWDASLTLAGAQTATFAAAPATATGLTFNYAGNFAMTLESTNATAQTFTLGGDISLNTGGGTTANVTIGNTANPLNVDLGSANRTLTVAASRTLTIVNAISSASGSYGITNAGAGTLTLNGTNSTFSGGTTLNAGTLVFGNGSALGTGPITLNGGTLKWNYVSGAVNETNNLVVNGPTTLDVAGGNWTQNGNISGSGAITRGQSGNLTLYLGGDNSGYTGTFTMPNNGNVVVRFTTTNTGSANASWVFNNATAGRTSLDFAGGTISFGSLTGAGQIQANVAGTKTMSVGALGLNDTFSGIIANNSATVGLTKVGSGTMTLSGVNTYTGPTTIIAGTLTIGGAGQLGGGNYAGAIINNGSLNYSSSAAQTLSGPISGSGNLTNNSSSTLTMSGVSTFAGNLVANAGTMVLSSPQSFAPNAVSVNDGATLNETFLSSIQMTATNLTLGVTTGATNGFVANSTSLARITAGTLTLNGVNTFNIIGGNLAAGSSYPLIAYTTLAGLGSYTLGTLPTGVAGNLSTSGNTIYFNVTGVTNTVWTGAVNGTWDINTTANWTNAGTLGNTYLNASPVQFDDTGLNTTTISNSVATTLSPISVLVTNNTQNYCFKANTIIAGNASLTKTGTANLTNSTPNTYTGPTAINQGQLVAGVASVANVSGAVGNNSAVTMGNDATAALNLNNFATQIGSLSGGGLTGGNVVLGSATLTMGADNTSTTYAGIVSGTGGLTKIGTGTLTLSGTNTFTGGWNVNAGTLNISSGSLGVSPATAAGQLTVNASGASSIVNIGSSANIRFNNANVLAGNNVGAAGAVFQTGTVTGVNQLQLGAITGGSYGYYNLSGSAALTIAELDCGGFNGAPTGVFDIAGGTLTDTAWLIIARGAGGPSLLNLTGGTVNFTGTAANQLIMNFNANATQSAVINVANANFNALNASAGILNMMRSGSAGEFAAVNLLSGGVMQVQGVNAGNTTGTSHFNFNGGTLKASTANANFLTANVSLANVYGGGGTIDNNGIAITIPKALSAPAGSGLNGSVTLNSGGSGYIGAPAVTFSGGGTGATAYATISGGAVTGVVITSPGVNYSSTPTVVFTGGGGSGAAATAPTPTANTSGPMTFTGAGITTLTGAYYVTGGINVAGGTLVMNTGSGTPSPAGDLTVSNATLTLDATSGSSMPAQNFLARFGSTINLTLNPNANGINATAGLYLGTNLTLNLTYGAVPYNPLAAAINASGSLTKGTNIVINISAGGLSVGVFPLITTGAAVTTNNFTLGTLPPGIRAVLTNNTANSLDLLVYGAGQLLSWRGANADNSVVLTNWDINTSSNWYDTSFNLTKYLQYSGNSYGDNVTFGDSGYNGIDGTNHVYLPANVVPATVTYSAAAPYVIAGPGGIGGTAYLLLTNATGVFNLNTSNSYTGGTFIGGGTLAITNDNALGNASVGVTLSGGTLQLNSSITNSRTVSITANSSIGVITNASAQLTTGINGSGNLTKTDNGTLTLAGNSLFGKTVVGQGTLNLPGAVTNTSAVTVGSVAGLDVNLNLSGNIIATNMLIGNISGVNASVVQAGGNSFIGSGGGDAVSVGNVNGAYGYYKVAGGTLTANGIAVGGENNTGTGFTGTGGNGLMDINGGNVNDIGWLVMTRGTAAELGVLNVYSGSSLAYAGGGLVCNWGTGQTSIINVMGGSVTSTNAGIGLGGAGNTGILNLLGGSAGGTGVSGNGGILNFNGGALMAAASSSGFVNVARANVYSNGGTIDDGGHIVTINQPLLAPVGYGVSSITVSGDSSGYVVPPIVTITGGAGSNATAIAAIAGGLVTGITVTSPGNGYGSSDGSLMSLAFTGGGASATAPSTSTFTLAPNTSGGLTKLGNGTLTLTGASTYTGNTVINAGKLIVTSAHQATNAVSVADTAAYGVALTGAPATVTNGAITLAAGATTLSFGLGTNGNPGQPLLFCGALTNNGTLNVTLGGNSSLLTVGSAIPLVKYSGSIAGAGSLNPTIAAPRGSSMTLSNDATGHTLYAVVNSLGGGIVWTGTNSAPGLTNLWDLNSTTNWLFAGSPTTYQETVPPGDAVTFNDLGSGTVLLSNTVNPASVTISNSAVDYTFQGTGSISGTTGLTKQGSGTATMNLANTYSGGTVISNGTLVIGNGSALGTGAVNVDGSTLTWKYVSGNATLTNNVVVNGSNTFDVVNGNCTINGNISGSGTMTRSAGVTPPISLYLGGDNSGFTGTFQDQNNANSVTRFSANSAGSANARWIFNQPTLGRTTLPSVSGTIRFGSVSGNGTLSDGGSGIANTIEVGALGLNDTFSGVIGQFTGTVGLTKVGTGTLVLSGANSYTGPTIVSNGTLNVSSAKVSAGDFTVADGATLGVNLATSGASLKMTTLTLGNNSTNSFTGISSTTVPAITNSGALTLSGQVVVNAQGFLSVGQYPLIYSAGGITGAGGFTVGTLPYGAAADIITNGGNTIVLNVTTAPAATVWNGVVDGNWNTTTTNWTAGATPVLYADGSSVQFDDTSSRTNVTIVTGVSPATVLVSNTVNQYTFTGGAIAGSASVTKSGTGTLILASTNTYTGVTTINAGALTVGGAGQLGGGNYSSAITNNGQFNYNSSVNQSLTGIISGTGSLAASGGSVIALGGLNTYGGGSEISNSIVLAGLTGWNNVLVSGSGNTVAANQQAALGAGAVTVDANGVLQMGYRASNTGIAYTITNNVVLNGGAVWANDAYQHLSGSINVNGTGGFLGSTYSGGSGTYGPASGYNKGLFIDGLVSGSGPLTIEQAGAGGNGAVAEANGWGNSTGNSYNVGIVLFTNNANTYSGTVTVYPYSAGGGNYLCVNGSTVLQNATINLVGNNTGGTRLYGYSPLTFLTGLGNVTLGALSGSADVVLTGEDEGHATSGNDPIALTVGGNNASTTYTGVMSGVGSLIKAGSGTFTLTGTNTYTGPTVVNAGTLAGTGIIAGALTNNATLAPGAGNVGTLTINGNITLNASSTNVFNVNGTTLTASNSVVAGASVNYGGVLNIVTGGTFSAGQQFQLFSGTGATNAGNFASIVGSPGSGMAFTFTNGVLSVVSTGPTGPANMTNSYDAGTHVLSLSWPADQGWRLQMQTNSLSTGLSTNWDYITDGTISSTNITVDPTLPTAFYRLRYP